MCRATRIKCVSELQVPVGNVQIIDANRRGLGEVRHQAGASPHAVLRPQDVGILNHQQQNSSDGTSTETDSAWGNVYDPASISSLASAIGSDTIRKT